MPQIVWITGSDGINEYYNQRWYDYTGTPPVPETEPLGWQAYIHADDVGDVLATWREACAVVQPWQCEYRLRRSDGVYLWHLGRSVPAIAQDGRVTRWFGTATDIDFQKGIQA